MTRSATGLRAAIDIGIAVLLVAGLGVVFAIDRAPPTEAPPPPPPPVVVKLPPKLPKLAVVRPPREWDDMGGLLDRLGTGYKYSPLRIEDLEQSGKLDGFEIVFLTCGPVPPSWVGEIEGEGGRETVSGRWNPAVRARVVANLRSFVAKGGTLYASDWAMGIIGAAFEETVDPELAGSESEGAVQDLVADVVDDGLRRSVGERLALHFDMPQWRPAAFRGRDVITYLKGTYQTLAGRAKTAPLLVRFRHEKGSIIFTSFHNEKVNSEAEQKLLQYLVFSALTESLAVGTYETILTSALSADSSSILSSVPGKSSESITYHLAAPGPLKVALLFNPGAHLKLVLKSPDGREFPKEGTSAFESEISAAPAGTWTCTVSVVEVPYPHFPFRLVVYQH